jgi:polyisoprenoid-binding protein YceI
MKTRLFILAALGLSCALLLVGCGKSQPPAEPDYKVLETTNAAPANKDFIRFDSKPGSNVRIEGTSSIHDWQVTGKLIGGYLEVGAGFPTNATAPARPGKVEARGEIFIPVRSLKSITKEGNAYSTAMDDIMYEKFLNADHPKIFYRVKELVLKTTPTGAGLPFVFDSQGELVVAGVTNQISLPVNITIPAENTIKVVGNTAVKMTQFNIKPPAPLTIMITTGDEVKLFFEWIAVRKTMPATNSIPPAAR